MSTPKPQLDHIDLSTNSRDTAAALIKLLSPHVPYSLSLLGSILNKGPRTSTLQDVDASKITLWSTIPLDSDAIHPPTLFSVVTFCHMSNQFFFFCSGESARPSDPPTDAEETHVRHVFEHLWAVARGAHPTYNTVLTPPCSGSSAGLTHRVEADPPMVLVAAVHAKWARALAPPTSTFQNPHVRYVFPPGVFRGAEGPCGVTQTVGNGMELEVFQIQAEDLPFVHGASSVPRLEAYILSRARYSVCLRSRSSEEAGVDGGQPLACALMHPDGSIGALHVDPNHQRQGLGRLVLHALAEKLDFNEGRGGDVISDGYRDLGGGALGWNWTDTSAQNEVANGFLTSLVGKENSWTCHWTYMLVNRKY